MCRKKISLTDLKKKTGIETRDMSDGLKKTLSRENSAEDDRSKENKEKSKRNGQQSRHGMNLRSRMKRTQS